MADTTDSKPVAFGRPGSSPGWGTRTRDRWSGLSKSLMRDQRLGRSRVAGHRPKDPTPACGLRTRRRSAPTLVHNQSGMALITGASQPKAVVTSSRHGNMVTPYTPKSTVLPERGDRLCKPVTDRGNRRVQRPTQVASHTHGEHS